MLFLRIVMSRRHCDCEAGENTRALRLATADITWCGRPWVFTYVGMGFGLMASYVLHRLMM